MRSNTDLAKECAELLRQLKGEMKQFIEQTKYVASAPLQALVHEKFAGILRGLKEIVQDAGAAEQDVIQRMTTSLKLSEKIQALVALRQSLQSRLMQEVADSAAIEVVLPISIPPRR